ncbi:hypothetical protein PV325_010061 [Microctonus aethiopoides]|uniref:Large ribosomal subunit protein bL21m n=1 Tax=Microctonus aethiopoides TaxID=144406 RepID=A0AA39C8V0_9HYME|nr:hypothetical protein PV325_010061 [Microctonus aethiopoides]KAK0095776.1 hypothetical protein PV326_007415 [Microctonus aethiopoides]KAK0159983.1 hypothetical protein PV328_007435 [Microctonus aethiopoides]
MAALRRLSGLFGAVNNYYLKPITSIINNNTSLSAQKTCKFQQFRDFKTYLPWLPKDRDIPMEVPELTQEEEKLSNDILNIINKQLETNTQSRLFAIVSITGKQFKVTENDIVVIQGYWPPNPGDTLKLEKVLLVGGTDFSLIGQPLLNREMVNITATVIEKTFSHTKIRFRMRKRKQYRRTKFERTQHTMVRINSIDVQAPIDVKKEVEGLDRIY